ncbi:RNA polymerase sigma-70 factor [Nostoc ellipsosporum NOK]|nr:RNA polymerase sigma-70 factor [Nostoc ellipsosporum NOK]
MISKESDKLRRLFEHCFNLHFEGLHRYAYTLLNDNEAARDAVQQVFLKLWEKRKELDEDRSVKAYLYTAVYHHCLNQIRHEKVKRQHAAQPHETNTKDDPVIHGELQRQIQETVAQLPPQCRLIFLKSRGEQKKYAEIAAELDLSVKTVEAQIGKALKILKEKLAKLMIW